MATILEAVGDYLAANSQGTLGTNLFLGRMPATPDVCVTVYEYEGSPPGETLGAGTGVKLDKPRLQLNVRASRDDYPTGRDKAMAIRDLLCAVTNQTLSGLLVLRIRPIGTVQVLAFDNDDRPRFVTNYEAIIGR